MTPKEYLSQLRQMDRIINQKLRKKAELMKFDGVSAVDCSANKVTHSTKPEASFVSVIEQIDLIERDVSALIDDYIDMKCLYMAQICAISNIKYRNILFDRYIEGKSLRDIAANMGLNYEYVKKLHGRALSAFGRLHEKIFQKFPEPS